MGEIDVGQLRLNGTAVTATAGNINQIAGLTASSFEMNKLDGATVSTSEINLLKDSQAGVIGTSNAVIYNSDVDTVAPSNLFISKEDAVKPAI
jgi:hypothetical protein